nr:hypothetical protein [Tanacetum cinerariifolium]
MFTTIKVVFWYEDIQLYGAILHDELINEAIKDSKSYKEYYAIASGAEPPKTKASVKKKQARSDQAPKAKTLAKAAKPAKKKLPAKTSKAKGLTIGSGADKGTGDKPGVPDVPTYGSDDEQISWKSSEEEDDDEVGISDDDANDDDDDDADNQEYNGQDDDNEQTNLNNDGDDFVYPKFSTHDQDEGKDEEDSFNPRVQTPSHVETTDDEDNDEEIQDVNVKGYELDEDEINEDDIGDELYRDMNVNLEGQDIEMTDAQQTNTVNEQVKAEVLTRSSNESKTSHVVAANLSKLKLKKLLIDKIESNKSIHRSNEQKNLYKALVEAYESDKLILDTYGETVTFKRHRDDADKDEEPFARSNRGSKRRRARKEPESTTKPPSLDRDWNKTLPDVYGHVQPWLSSLAQMEDPRESFNELLDTPLDFTTFLMNQLKVDTLTPELLASPTFELMKGSCKSMVELEYFLKKVYKATTNQLDWNNPKGQQYPHDLCKPLPLIPNFRGRQVIPSDHFINNDLAYLSGGVLRCQKQPKEAQPQKLDTYGSDLNEGKLIQHTPILESRSIQDKAFLRRQRFQDKEKYEHVGPKVTRSQEDKRLQDDEKKRCLADDPKKMEILLEPTFNKLMVGDLCDSIRIKPVTTGKKRCGLYTNDDWNEVKQLLRVELRLTLAIAMAKNINGEAQIHAKVDGKKVIIFEATIKRDLKFEDKGGVDCLSNEFIFEQLTLIGVESSTEEQNLDEEDASKQGRNIADIDADA